MADVFNLQIISPAAVLVDAHVAMTEVPGVEGDFGVLPGHAPFFSMIRPGVISVYLPDGTRRRFFATAGYADVSPAGCTILSEHIEDLAEISVGDVLEALNAAREAYHEASTIQEKAKAQAVLTSAEALHMAVTSH